MKALENAHKAEIKELINKWNNVIVPNFENEASLLEIELKKRHQNELESFKESIEQSHLIICQERVRHAEVPLLERSAEFVEEKRVAGVVGFLQRGQKTQIKDKEAAVDREGEAVVSKQGEVPEQELVVDSEAPERAEQLEAETREPEGKPGPVTEEGVRDHREALCERVERNGGQVQKGTHETRQNESHQENELKRSRHVKQEPFFSLKLYSH